ncbi:hypothetical protein [Plantactinospora sonchi]|uniref:Uncharacterized protein n=1 Tax=Plantactinospora sonchi TaxID=1544735 RepID=A0ABU7RLY0_9ACTN
MNTILDPPAERDLPRGRAARMRADLVASVSPPEGRAGLPWSRGPVAARVRRPVLVVAAAALVAAGLTVLPTIRDDNSASTVLAMGADELSPTLRRATEWCLEQNDEIHRIPITTDDLAVAAQRSHHSVMLFLTESAYFECSVDLTPGREFSGGVGSEPDWRTRDWLPGLVQQMMLTSSELRSGEVAVSGRVSGRVHRLVLEHGDGRHTTARLANGTFGLVSRGDVTSRAELVGYDHEGREIARQLLFDWRSEDRCYTDPNGNVVYGKAGPDCHPAEPWGY